MPAPVPITRALVSVSDKTGLVEFARGLVDAGVEILSTGGTRVHLQNAGVPVRDVAEYTGFPEMMDGRLKTLHPKVHGAILCRRDNDRHMAAAAEHGIAPIDLVVVNLYPFEQTVAKPDVAVADAIEHIDIGGPSMVRSAAKNHQFVTVATDPRQYATILEQIRADGGTTPAWRRELAAAAFARTAAYDAAIAKYLLELASPVPAVSWAGLEQGEEAAIRAAVEPPQEESGDKVIRLTRRSNLRYGENPHQAAAVYASPDAGPHALVNAEQLHGKELSYNNLLDLDAALACVRSLPRPAVAVLKHNNPCGAATGPTLADAVDRAWQGDPLAAFGSVLGVNVSVDAAMANFLAEPGRFVEAIVAPDFTPDALAILTTKPKWRENVRLLRVGALEMGAGAAAWRPINGGMLRQDADDLPDDPAKWRVVTQAQPSDEQRQDLQFAWAVCRHVKSNAIVLAKDAAVVGVGAGQMSRVDAVEIAIRKAGDRARDAVLASDAFFPFADSIEAAASAGIGAVIQPGGSRRDAEVIAACDALSVPMIFTGTRHFRH